MAMQITVTLPSALSNLPKDEQEILIRAGLGEAAAARVRQIADEIAEAGEMIQRYEARYGVTLAQFEIEQLQGLEGVQLHEDYNERHHGFARLTKS